MTAPADSSGTLMTHFSNGSILTPFSSWKDYFWSAYLELKSFTTHSLDEDSEVELTTTCHDK
jgi:hypothetical protein